MKDMILGIVRHALTTFGGVLISKGIITASNLDQGVGAVVTIIGIAWSVLSKNKTN